MSFKKKKNSDPIDFNAYGLKPTGYYLDSLKDLSRDLDRMEQNYSDADTLLSCIKEAEAAADQLIRETGGEGAMLKSDAPKTQAEKSPETPDLKDLLAELDSLVGLEKIKENVKSLINLVKVRKLREENGLSSPAISLHLVFMGNPGTGKTTVARLIAQLYHAIGVLSKGQLVEVDRSGLVAGFVGQTAIKTNEVIKKALGGVLFIDEAYSLASSSSGAGGADFGQEAIETLLKAMEDNRDDFVVIVAGYENLMENFINSNPGLESRFNRYFIFEDYTGQQLYEIFLSMCKKNQYILDEGANEYSKKFFEDMYQQKDENFGNARDVRNIFENIITIHSNRVAQLENPTKDDLMTICKEDIEKAGAM